MSAKNKSLFCIYLLVSISFIPLFMNNKSLIENSYIIYFFLALVGFVACYEKDSLRNLVTPNSIIFFYFILTFLLGSWGFSNEYILVKDNLNDFYNWQNRQLTTSLSMLCPSLFLIVDIMHQKKYKFFSSKITWSNHNGAYLSGILFLLPFFFIPLNLEFLGAQGDLAIVPKGIAAIALILYLSKLKTVRRYLGYGALIVFFSTFSSDEKREAIFLIFPIIWMEVYRYELKPSLRIYLAGFLMVASIGALILSMSIVRGYGNFEDVSGIFDALILLPQYISSDIFISALLVNIEATYLYFHSLNSIDMVLSDLNLLAYGSTLIKPLFIMFPRDIFPFKPDSILELYTIAYDPAGRDLGGSWTIGLFSEFIWNFYFFGIFMVIFVAKFLSEFNIYLMRSVSSINPSKTIIYLFIFLHLLTWVRGSGLDQYVMYIMIGIFSVSPIFLIHQLFKPFVLRRRA